MVMYVLLYENGLTGLFSNMCVINIVQHAMPQHPSSSSVTIHSNISNTLQLRDVVVRVVRSVLSDEDCGSHVRLLLLILFDK